MQRREFGYSMVAVTLAPKLLLAQQASPAPPPPAPVPWTLGLNPKTPLPHTAAADALAEADLVFFSAEQMAALTRLSDLLMPQMDGNELVRRMKQMAPEVPMILISGSVKAFERANHADAFLPKGACTPLDMLDRIRVMIARKRGPKKLVTVPGAVEPMRPVRDGYTAVAS